MHSRVYHRPTPLQGVARTSTPHIQRRFCGTDPQFGSIRMIDSTIIVYSSYGNENVSVRTKLGVDENSFDSVLKCTWTASVLQLWILERSRIKMYFSPCSIV